MKLRIEELKKKDYKKAIQFAITGMHFNWYMDNRFLLNMYGKYFWYLEMTRATQIIAAYVDGEFAGVLLAAMDGEKRKYYSFWKSVYVKLFDILQKIFVRGGVDVYNETNKELYKQYRKSNIPNGEIIFLAANPNIKVKGIGSLLLNEFKRREKGKKVFLYTDDACTYQFYEHRGFECAGKKDVILRIGNKKINLRCFLYDRVM